MRYIVLWWNYNSNGEERIHSVMPLWKMRGVRLRAARRSEQEEDEIDDNKVTIVQAPNYVIFCIFLTQWVS